MREYLLSCIALMSILITTIFSGCTVMTVYPKYLKGGGLTVPVRKNDWPFLTNMVDGYFHTYLEYPDVDELIKYWELNNPEMERMNGVKIRTPEKLKRKRERLFTVKQDTVYYLLYKHGYKIDTLEQRSGDYYDFYNTDYSTRRNFFYYRILMYDLKGVYIGEIPELMKEFYRGRAEIIRTLDPLPPINEELSMFVKASVLKYDREKGLYNMFPKDGFVLDEFEYKERIEDFVKDFTEKHNLRSVIFAFPHN